CHDQRRRRHLHLHHPLLVRLGREHGRQRLNNVHSPVSPRPNRYNTELHPELKHVVAQPNTAVNDGTLSLIVWPAYVGVSTTPPTGGLHWEPSDIYYQRGQINWELEGE